MSNAHFSQEEPRRVECILIDDREGANPRDRDSAASFLSEKTQLEGKFSLKMGLMLRLVALGGVICSLACEVAMLLTSSILTLLAACYLFRNAPLNRRVAQSWRVCFHALVMSLGFLVGILSPVMGFGLMMLYCAMMGNVLDDPMLRQILRTSFQSL